MRLIHYLEAHFYSNNGLIVLKLVGQLQQTIDVLEDLFDCVGLRTNVRKTVSMVSNRATPLEACQYIHTHSV